MPAQTQPVTPADLEHLLASLEGLPGEPGHGFFGPDSITWRVNRESAVFLGAGRAALLQLAHPWVAAALAQHSNLLHDAIGRFHSTFRVIYTMLFGTRAQALAASRQLYRRHTGIRGEVPVASGAPGRGEHYQANEVAALCWVYATLVESAVAAYDFALPPLTPAECQAYYEESKRMASLFGIPPEALPQDWLDFRRYTVAMLGSASLSVDASARAMGESVLAGVGTWVRPPGWYRALTASWLPERLRTAFGLSLAASDRASLDRAALWLPRVYKRLPNAVRFVGPYHEAQARLRGRSLGPFTRRSNRFWMGEDQLLFPRLPT